MILTKEIIANGNGKDRDHQFFVKVNEVVTISVINMRELLTKWNGKAWEPYDNLDDGVEYEVGIVVDNFPAILRRLVGDVDAVPEWVGGRVATYYGLTLDEVNHLIAQVKAKAAQ